MLDVFRSVGIWKLPERDTSVFILMEAGSLHNSYTFGIGGIIYPSLSVISKSWVTSYNCYV